MSISAHSVESIREQAARWVVLINEGELSEGDRQTFVRWLLRDERHEREFRAHVTVLGLAGDLPADLPIDSTEEPRSNVIPLTPAASARPAPVVRRSWMAAAAAVLVVVAAGWLFLDHSGRLPRTHATGVGEMRTVTFADGSVAYLNTRTRLAWAGSASDRRVVLHAGEALFDVVPDSERPFCVVVDESEVVVRGTRFNVYRKKGDVVVVTVLEGSVEVRERGSSAARAGAPSWSRRLDANQQIIYSPVGLTRDVQAIDALNAAKWREGVLELTDEPLPNVLDELMRYTDQRILIRDPRLAQLRLGGALSTRDVRAALARIEKLAPIAVTESGNTFTLDYRTQAREEIHKNAYPDTTTE